MLRSMTGYGRKEATVQGVSLALEMRSVNHRYLELGIRLPEEVRAVESHVRERVASSVKRGKVDLALKIQADGTSNDEVSINAPLAEHLIAAATSIADMSPRSGPIDPVRIMQWPGVVGLPKIDPELLQKEVLSMVDDVLVDFIASREREGLKTLDMLGERVDAIEEIVQKVRAARPDVVERLTAKLKKRIGELDVQVDYGRLEQELAYVSQKLDVDEELDRLDAHISETRKIFKRKEPTGRRLDFLMQEFNREANTLSSKAADCDTTGFSVDLKVLIEQMREQIQNIE